jgi:hypothetical protein
MSLVDTKQFSIDGHALAKDDFNNFKVVSPLFQIVYPDGNVFNQFPTNVKQKAVAQGYWVLVKGLEPGEHTIEVVSGLSAFDFLTDVTYDLTIEGKHSSSMLHEHTNPRLGVQTGDPQEPNSQRIFP